MPMDIRFIRDVTPEQRARLEAVKRWYDEQERHVFDAHAKALHDLQYDLARRMEDEGLGEFTGYVP